jgi:hypothetical protein
LNAKGAGPAEYGSATFITLMMEGEDAVEVWASMYDVSPEDRLPSPDVRAGVVVGPADAYSSEMVLEATMDLLGGFSFQSHLAHGLFVPSYVEVGRL